MIAKILVVLALLGMASEANANAIYTYVGNPFADIVDVPFPAGSFDTSMRVTGQFELANALSADMPMTDLTGQILSFSFSNGRATLSNVDPFTSLAVFSVSTDALGAINGWAISVQRLQAVNGGLDLTAQTFNDPTFGFPLEDSGQVVACDPIPLQRGLCVSLADVATVGGAPGAWTRSDPGDPATVPEPGTMTLMLTGLAASFRTLRAGRAAARR